MPRFEPFPAVRYSPSQPLQLVIAPPYDVLSDADVDRFAARDDHNIVVIDVPRERDGDDRYQLAGQRLNDWIAQGVLIIDKVSTFTLYRMKFVDEAGRPRATVGVVGALEVVDEGGSGVLPHERTTPKAKSDRLDLTRATNANLSPIWGLSLATGLSELLSEPGEHVGQYTDQEGVEHIVERVSDPDRCGAIARAVASQPVVIADGHHRYAISRTYRDEQRDLGSPATAACELTLAYIGELVEDQLSVAAIHRLVNGITHSQLLDELERFFELSPAGEVGAAHARQVVEQHSLCLVSADGQGTFLKPLAYKFEGVRDLDSARLEHALNALPAVELRYQHGVTNIVNAVRSGEAIAGVLLRPVSVEEIRRTADERLLMPPKSTFFTPKLQTGLVIRQL